MGPRHIKRDETGFLPLQRACLRDKEAKEPSTGCCGFSRPGCVLWFYCGPAVVLSGPQAPRLHYPGVRTKGENVRKCSGHAIWLDNYRGTGYEVLRALLPEHTEPADEKRRRTGLHRGRERGGATWVG